MARGELGWRYWFVQYVQASNGSASYTAAGFLRKPQMKHMPHLRNLWMWFPRSVYPEQHNLPTDLIEIAIWP
jgi:hypothetical protein